MLNFHDPLITQQGASRMLPHRDHAGLVLVFESLSYECKLLLAARIVFGLLPAAL